jgi:hypothetical protein
MCISPSSRALLKSLRLASDGLAAQAEDKDADSATPGLCGLTRAFAAAASAAAGIVTGAPGANASIILTTINKSVGVKGSANLGDYVYDVSSTPQAAMLQRLGRRASTLRPRALAAQYASQEGIVARFLARRRGIGVLPLDYADVLGGCTGRSTRDGGADRGVSGPGLRGGCRRGGDRARAQAATRLMLWEIVEEVGGNGFLFLKPVRPPIHRERPRWLARELRHRGPTRTRHAHKIFKDNPPV